MRISVSGAGSASFVAARSSSTKSAERQAFGQFTKALKANDLEGAKSADKSMVANAPAGASRDSDSAFAQLGKAIQSGDVSAAKSACVSMVKSRRSQAPVETAKPITVKAVIGGGVDSRINLSA